MDHKCKSQLLLFNQVSPQRWYHIQRPIRVNFLKQHFTFKVIYKLSLSVCVTKLNLRHTSCIVYKSVLSGMERSINFILHAISIPL